MKAVHVSLIVTFLSSLALCDLALAKKKQAGLPTSEAAVQIDRYIRETLEEKGLERNEEVDDATFARRIYLDIVGRIPTYDELTRFEKSLSTEKRARLIDELLDSSGYASHFYNYWEDVLRIQSRGRRTVMVSYQDWVKESLRENMPYDEFVRELISSSGFVWDEPAVGYYLRDAGMPLDNMSNTAQVFLGTRMQCAQCHDHPFDRWTQREYYHMAAYTFGVDSATRGYRNIPEFEEFQEAARFIRRAEFRANGGPQGNNRRGTINERRVIRDIFEPLGTEVTVNNKPLKLPKDYQYEDAKPNQKMAAKTPFGPEAKVGKRDNPQEVYAKWLTSPENPRFTKTIANRLWKKAMGVGLIEPVDDIKEDTVASHPELMRFLEDLMVSYDYDMKRFLKAIFSTRTYQSFAYDKEPVAGEPYFFPGPTLRRMSAEQLWDSVLTMSVPDLDQKLGGDVQTKNLRVNEAQMKDHVAKVQKLDGRELYAIVRRLGALQEKYLEAEKLFQTQINAARTDRERNELRSQFREIRLQKNKAMDALLAQVSGSEVFDRREAMVEMNDEMMSSSTSRRKGKQARQLEKARRNLVRASEVVSPAPAGHFLRQFGESDREIIESSTDEAAIPQALALLNGNLYYMISNQSSVLSRELRGLEGKQRMDVVFKSFYGRSPTDRERELVGEQIDAYGHSKGYRQVMLALLNSQEFRFIQ
ncbi:DUF1549 domain-containing protein [Pelagicoccus mobilis]|uniref:DUF1549 domain-containing protein n=1 Tax=Pelagicoccus mobilis TaxID=415221 RepID=A0A934VT40_9BACT|nr:DUF1549 domain-containing protein [Pelagicoccus mobilis]MBK1879124.1 DUF1549 domain-containing protein [Pelagicoccus mobilis]